MTESSNSALLGANLYISIPKPKDAAFLLYQTVERLYNGLLLVMTLYTPKSHNLVRLRQMAETRDLRLMAVWPKATKFEKRCFELLRAAYVKARYSRHSTDGGVGGVEDSEGGVRGGRSG